MKPIRITAEIVWQAAGDFAANAYSRGHVWRFDGGVEVPASASPHVVPAPHSITAAVDPEEAYLAAISSCHMLWFLDFARRDGWVVEHYRDQAEAEMTRDADGTIWMSRAELGIAVAFAGDSPDPAAHEALHDRAHKACFIANSVKTEITHRLSTA